MESINFSIGKEQEFKLLGYRIATSKNDKKYAQVMLAYTIQPKKGTDDIAVGMSSATYFVPNYIVEQLSADMIGKNFYGTISDTVKPDGTKERKLIGLKSA